MPGLVSCNEQECVSEGLAFMRHCFVVKGLICEYTGLWHTAVSQFSKLIRSITYFCWQALAACLKQRINPLGFVLGDVIRAVLLSALSISGLFILVL